MYRTRHKRTPCPLPQSLGLHSQINMQTRADSYLSIYLSRAYNSHRGHCRGPNMCRTRHKRAFCPFPQSLGLHLQVDMLGFDVHGLSKITCTRWDFYQQPFCCQPPLSHCWITHWATAESPTEPLACSHSHHHHGFNFLHFSPSDQNCWQNCGHCYTVIWKNFARKCVKLFVEKFLYSTKLLIVFNYLLCLLKIFHVFNFYMHWWVWKFFADKNFPNHGIIVVMSHCWITTEPLDTPTITNISSPFIY